MGWRRCCAAIGDLAEEVIGVGGVDRFGAHRQNRALWVLTTAFQSQTRTYRLAAATRRCNLPRFESTHMHRPRFVASWFLVEGVTLIQSCDE
jgi:hypothetical protein